MPTRKLVVTLLDGPTDAEVEVGAFEWVQWTYGEIRFPPDGDPKDSPIREGRAGTEHEGKYLYAGKWYSDLVIAVEEPPGDPNVGA
jgi:hypothetical protein